jgi:hypothetical protein
MSAAARAWRSSASSCTQLAEGHREVLIVHGRGRNSKDNVPVLKDAEELARAGPDRPQHPRFHVGAFPPDGGTVRSLRICCAAGVAPEGAHHVYDGRSA